MTETYWDEESHRMTTINNSYRGVVYLVCPVYKCHFTDRFTESDATLQDKEGTLARREAYLKLAHEAGKHRPKA